MSSKKDNTGLDELMIALRGERPRWEIEVIVDRVRQKIAEENKHRDLHKLMKENTKLIGKCENLQRSLVFWQGTAITLLGTILAIIVALLIR